MVVCGRLTLLQYEIRLLFQTFFIHVLSSHALQHDDDVVFLSE